MALHCLSQFFPLRAWLVYLHQIHHDRFCTHNLHLMSVCGVFTFKSISRYFMGFNISESFPNNWCQFSTVSAPFISYLSYYYSMNKVTCLFCRELILISILCFFQTPVYNLTYINTPDSFSETLTLEHQHVEMSARQLPFLLMRARLV